MLVKNAKNIFHFQLTKDKIDCDIIFINHTHEISILIETNSKNDFYTYSLKIEPKNVLNSENRPLDLFKYFDSRKALINEINNYYIIISINIGNEKYVIIKNSKESKFITIDDKVHNNIIFNIKIKKNEYYVLWRDPNFDETNYHSQFLDFRHLFCIKNANMILHPISSMEKALKFVKRRINNKIIFITNVGIDYSGKRFIEIVRKIYGFDIIVLFFSDNSEKHFSWIKNFPNCLYDGIGKIYKEYLTKYNEEDLKELRLKNVKAFKNLSLMEFKDDFLKYSNTNIILKNDFCPYIRHAQIYCKNKKKYLCMGKDGKVKCAYNDNDEDSYWNITILGNTITFNCNGFYLKDNNNGEIEGDKIMKIWIYNLSNKINYSFFYTNNKSNNILSMEGPIIKIIKYKTGDPGYPGYFGDNEKFLLMDVPEKEKSEDSISMLTKSFSSSISPFDLTSSKSISSK